MRVSGWEYSEVTKGLRDQIEEYVVKIINEAIPQLPLEGYLQYIEHGSRKESEAAYFEIRKQLTALALHLQWCQQGVYYKQEVNRLQEIIWEITNEFTWCLAAHLPIQEIGFAEEPSRQIDLFAAETAATLAEILSIHSDILHPILQFQIRQRIEERIFTPFLEQEWGWETLQNNWSAVCGGSIGMAALLLSKGEQRRKLLAKVDRALEYYLEGFGKDGATEEGVGYWVYGFGYYTYYTEMRLELDDSYESVFEEKSGRLRTIAEFPRFLQMSKLGFVPFSDSMAEVQLPSGLLCYLKKKYRIEIPAMYEVTSFDFDHCYRFQHISRNLWWTQEELLSETAKDFVTYFAGKQWLLHRKNPYYFAVKGGNNGESHNHNDVGSFILTIAGEQLLADIGAGPYTKDYFGEKRYTCAHTRSYYHNVPVIAYQEQKFGEHFCKVLEVSAQEDHSNITLELSELYELPELQCFERSIRSDMEQRTILLEDYCRASMPICFEEGFLTVVKPQLMRVGCLMLPGRNGRMTLSYDDTMLYYKEEKVELLNHYGRKEVVYRVGLWAKELAEEHKVTITISYE